MSANNWPEDEGDEARGKDSRFPSYSDNRSPREESGKAPGPDARRVRRVPSRSDLPVESDGVKRPPRPKPPSPVREGEDNAASSQRPSRQPSGELRERPARPARDPSAAEQPAPRPSRDAAGSKPPAPPPRDDIRPARTAQQDSGGNEDQERGSVSSDTQIKPYTGREAAGDVPETSGRKRQPPVKYEGSYVSYCIKKAKTNFFASAVLAPATAVFGVVCLVMMGSSVLSGFRDMFVILAFGGVLSLFLLFFGKNLSAVGDKTDGYGAASTVIGKIGTLLYITGLYALIVIVVTAVVLGMFIYLLNGTEVNNV